jgi:hypothetical protein
VQQDNCGIGRTAVGQFSSEEREALVEALKASILDRGRWSVGDPSCHPPPEMLKRHQDRTAVMDALREEFER